MAPFCKELTTCLDNLGLTIEETANGRVCRQISDSNVVMQLWDRRVLVIRSTVELISNVTRMPDLLQEIQQQDERLIFTTHFISARSVFPVQICIAVINMTLRPTCMDLSTIPISAEPSWPP